MLCFLLVVPLSDVVGQLIDPPHLFRRITSKLEVDKIKSICYTIINKRKGIKTMIDIYKLTATTKANEIFNCYFGNKAEAENVRKELKNDKDIKHIIITKNK